MTIIVCEAHSMGCERYAAPGGKQYVSATEPVGYPNAAVICFIDDCETPGLVWLEQWEEDAIRNPPHRLVFPIEGNWAKVKV
jgi:hypothetical protein